MTDHHTADDAPWWTTNIAPDDAPFVWAWPHLSDPCDEWPWLRSGEQYKTLQLVWGSFPALHLEAKDGSIIPILYAYREEVVLPEFDR
jgi:hypothetical protein